MDFLKALRDVKRPEARWPEPAESRGHKVSFKSGPSISIKGVGLTNMQGPPASQVPQVPAVMARMGSARIAWNRVGDTCTIGAKANRWAIHELQEKGGVRVGGGLQATAVMSDVSRVMDGLRDPGDATAFNFAYVLDAQACLQPTSGTVLRGKVSYSRPFTTTRLIDQEPYFINTPVRGASTFRMKAQLEGQGGSAVGVQMIRSVAAAEGLLGAMLAPRTRVTTELYAKWRMVGKEGPVLRVGYQPETGIIGVSAGIAF